MPISPGRFLTSASPILTLKTEHNGAVRLVVHVQQQLRGLEHRPGHLLLP